MLRLKTRWFAKWAKKSFVSDAALLKTIQSLTNNLNTVDLGGGLFKVRTPRKGQGKSGSFRTLIVYRKGEIAIFVYGFSKSERDNLDKDELKDFKKLAKDLLRISPKEYLKQIELGNFIKLEKNNEEDN